ncbi:MAG: hypothetical protein MK116_10030 [Phycisphaerales bacterium]|nr:hypothetical protein [Phycisphaerales bacterium]
MRALLHTLLVTTIVAIALATSAIASNTNSTVYVVNTDGNLGGIQGDPFYNAAIYWALQELGMIGPNGEYPHPDSTDPTKLVYTRDDGTTVQVGTISGEAGEIVWTNSNKQSLYDMAGFGGLDQPWQAVWGGNATTPGKLIIATHGSTGNGKVGVFVPPQNINVTGIDIGGLTHAGFKEQGTNSTGTGLQSECPNYPGPFGLYPRANDNISVFLNSCYSTFDPPGDDRRSVSDTLSDVPGVGTVTGYESISLKRLRIDFNGNATAEPLAVAALEREAIRRGFSRVRPGAAGQPARTDGLFGLMAGTTQAKKARSMLQQIIANANITGVTVTMRITKAPRQLAATPGDWDYFLPPFTSSASLASSFCYNPAPAAIPVLGNVNTTALEPCGKFQVITVPLSATLHELGGSNLMSAGPPMTVLGPDPDAVIPCELFFQVPHHIVLAGVVDATDDTLVPLSPMFSPQGIGAATTTDRILLPVAVDTRCPADIVDDGTINVDDLLQMLAAYGLTDPGSILVGDLNGDFLVDVNDLLLLLGNWGSCPWPADAGACCTDHDCWLTLPDVCLEASGDWRGPGSRCDTADCTYGEPIGACCYYDADGIIKCLETVVTECQAFGRPYLGLRCDEVDCPASFGACCIPSDTGTTCLDNRTADECTGVGGEYQGPNTWCEDQPCPDDAACCLEDTCADLAQDDCLGSGGTWIDGLSCDDEPCDPALPNDECAGALLIAPGVHELDTTGASTDGPANDFADCDPANPTIYRDLWYAIDRSTYSFGAVSTCGTALFDTRIAVYHGSCDGGLELIACNDDTAFCPGGTSEIFCDFLPGRTYIRIGGADKTAAGTGMFRVDIFKGN